MRLRGEYEPVQDRILLKLWGGQAGSVALWLTRRQWLAIAVACDRARAAAALQTPDPESSEIGQRPPETGDYEEGGEECLRTSLITGVRFQSIPFGLRIKLTTEERVSLFLPLTGESLISFTRLVERLATRAKWDLPAAMSRMKNAKPVRKQLMN